MPKWPSKFWGTPSNQFDDGMALSIGEDVGDATASKQDLDSLMPMSGSCYLPQGDSKTQTGGQRFLPFNVANGDSRGCEVSSEDGLILNEVGMWRVEVSTKTIVEQIVGSGASGEIRLELFDPDGSFVRRRIFGLNAAGIAFSNSVDYSHCWMNVIVDRPGYRVRVYQYMSNASGMRTWNSSEFTELFAQYVYNGTPRFAAA